ncbi:hypothetical protein [Pseudonocardia sp. T1-2H]|uniref:hypothetical protein n=1 Tax=Pseudonocardia sp. T1-2H TaxID=3128899 RepID=UPI00310151F6
MRPAADVPLLMIAFNRPEKTQRVFEAVRAAAPRRLYLAADGPRADVPSDVDRCERTRRVLDDVTWPCEVQRLYQPGNLGCKRGVGAAIDWFLAHEDSGIILEDDCLPTVDFFPFCAELLERYRDTPEVMMIGGHNPLGTWGGNEASYLFSRTAPIWGWATWRRAWARYDPTMTRWGEPEARALVRSRMPLSEYRITSQKFDGVYEGRLDSWGFAWTLALLINGGVSVMPARNVITNIGFDSEATHTRRPSRRAGAVPAHPIERPLRHPPSTTPDSRFERALFKNNFPLGRRLVATLPPPAQYRFREAVYRLAAAAERRGPP